MGGPYSILILLLALLISAVASTEWSLEDAKLSISSIDGSARIAESFTSTKAPSISSLLDLSSDEVIKLAFTLQSSGGSKLKAEELPHQVVISLTDAHDPLRIASSIVSVKTSTGKASWNQRIDRLPTALIQGSGEVQLTLLIASFGETQHVKLPLLRFKVPASLSDSKGSSSAKDSPLGFQRHPEQRHTFNVSASEQMPPKIVSLVSAIITLLLPSAVLAYLLSLILPSLSFRSISIATAPFLASLFSLEFLALFYWLGRGFTLFKMMPWLLALGTISLFVGRAALSEMRRVRNGKQV